MDVSDASYYIFNEKGKNKTFLSIAIKQCLYHAFISLFIEYVIASIAYIDSVYGGIWTHDLLDVSLLP